MICKVIIIDFWAEIFYKTRFHNSFSTLNSLKTNSCTLRSLLNINSSEYIKKKTLITAVLPNGNIFNYNIHKHRAAVSIFIKYKHDKNVSRNNTNSGNDHVI